MNSTLKNLPLAAVLGMTLSGQAYAQTAPAPSINPILPHNLSPWGMFMSADIVVKAVMVGLIFASVLTWTIWLYKTFELYTAQRRASNALGQVAGAHAARGGRCCRGQVRRREPSAASSGAGSRAVKCCVGSH